jgi:hypothetical protein
MTDAFERATGCCTHYLCPGGRVAFDLMAGEAMVMLRLTRQEMEGILSNLETYEGV